MDEKVAQHRSAKKRGLDRTEVLSKALKANLQRRKQQTKQRQQSDNAASHDDDPGQTRR